MWIDEQEERGKDGDSAGGGVCELSSELFSLVAGEGGRMREFFVNRLRDTERRWYQGGRAEMGEGWQERVEEERRELVYRLARLQTFIRGEEFKVLSPDEQERLLRQERLMGEFCQVLAERIVAFAKRNEFAEKYEQKPVIE